MRKLDPDDVRADFDAEAVAIVGHFDRISGSLAGTATKEGDISRLAANSFLALFVAFERFISDLFLAYLNRDFTTYRADLTNRLNASIQTRFGAAVLGMLTVHPKAHVSVAELEAIVDADGWNLTFSTVQDMKACATRWLIPAHAARINSIGPGEQRLIDTARAIRNFIAHQSPGSKLKMNDLLATVETGNHNRHLARGAREVHAVGSYLKATHVGQRRLHRYSTALLAISAHI